MTSNPNYNLNLQKSEQWYNENYKEVWRNANLKPSSKEDTQLPFLIKTLKKELDINKIETVLEVGVGYGRVAKAILEAFPNVQSYIGIDISEYAVKQSEEYCKKWCDKGMFWPWVKDFEDKLEFIEGADPLYDLVLSVETMSVVPSAASIPSWIWKMVSLSKKYVVNIDFTRGQDTITNTPPHFYKMEYNAHPKVYTCKEIPIPNHESIFICRVF